MRGMTNSSRDSDGIRGWDTGWKNKTKTTKKRCGREEGDDLFYFVTTAVNLYRKLKQFIYN